MVSFATDQPTLAEVVSSLDVLLDEIVMDFGDDAVHANGVDPADIAMIDLTLSESAFESYEGDQTSRGVDLVRLGDTIGMAESSDMISVEEDDRGRFDIEFSGLNYTMALIDPDSVRDGQDIPSLDWDATFTVNSDFFTRGCTAADMVSDHITLEIDDETLKLSAKGDTDDVNLDASKEEDVEVDFDSEPTNCESIFSLEYFKDVVSALPDDTQTRVSMGDDLVVVLEADIADGHGTVAFALAPRIQAD